MIDMLAQLVHAGFGLVFASLLPVFAVAAVAAVLIGLIGGALGIRDGALGHIVRTLAVVLVLGLVFERTATAIVAFAGGQLGGPRWIHAGGRRSMNVALAGILLASARLWACLRVQASWRSAIGPTWEWIAGALAVSVSVLAWSSGRLGSSPDALALTLAPALVFELLLGSVLGLAISLPSWALLGAARESEQALGWQGESGSLARLLVVASLAGGLALGLHAPLCAGLLGLFDRFPLARPSAWVPALEQLPEYLIDRAVALALLGLALATPVLLTRAIVALCLSTLGRERVATTELLDVVTPGLRLAAGLVALGAAWSAYPEAFARAM